MLDQCPRRACEGGVAGAVATVVMTLEQPLDKRLFDNLGDAEVQLEQVRAVEAPGVTHIKYRSVK